MDCSVFTKRIRSRQCFTATPQSYATPVFNIATPLGGVAPTPTRCTDSANATVRHEKATSKNGYRGEGKTGEEALWHCDVADAL